MIVRTIDIELPTEYSYQQREAMIASCVHMSTNVSIPDLVLQIQKHYQKWDADEWRNGFMKAWFEKITNCTIAIKNNDVAGIMMYMHYRDSVYIRLLCSKDHCGGHLLKYIIHKYPQKTISLNSEIHVVGFYEKFGFNRMWHMPLECGIYPYMSRKPTALVDGGYVFEMFKYLFNFALN